MERGISTFSRFMYLNSYAFLCIIIGVGIGLIPLYKISLWLLLPQAMLVFVPLKIAYGILSTWDDKKRKYRMLMERNKTQLRPDTFTEFMQAPCGKLLSKIVLKDLGQTEQYAELKKLIKPLSVRLKEGCKPQKTVVVYVNKDFDKERDEDGSFAIKK